MKNRDRDLKKPTDFFPSSRSDDLSDLKTVPEKPVIDFDLKIDQHF
jgi:hypothetical protein